MLEFPLLYVFLKNSKKTEGKIYQPKQVFSESYFLHKKPKFYRKL